MSRAGNMLHRAARALGAGPSGALNRGLVGLLAAALACASVAPLRAQTAASHRLAGAGLVMHVETRWADGPGYRPVRIALTPTAAVTADRTLTIEILVFELGQQHALRVAQDVEIPSGTLPVRATVLVPNAVSWGNYAINVVEDGALVPSLCVPRTGTVVPGNASVDALPRILFVGDRVPNTRSLASSLPVQQYVQFLASAGMSPISTPPRGLGGQLPTAMNLPAGQLPERWIEYTSFDVICAGQADLEVMARTRPEAFRAVMAWTAAGGSLWVFGVGEGFARLGGLESLLGMPPGHGDRESPPVDRGWREPDRATFGQPLSHGSGRGMPTYYSPRYGPLAMPAPMVEDGRALAEPSLVLPAAPKEAPFVLRDLQAGLVVAWAARDPLPGTPSHWAWVLNSMRSERWQWCERHGMSLFRANRDFWNFLIPGVGLVPAVEFGVLITLFVLVIGPLNYVLLKRWKRLHLLVVTVPVSAALITLALFGYAVLADGLGTRVRVRSLTLLDQRSNRAACWARMSYYAGITPSGGLSFSDETAVYPVEAYPGRAFDDESGRSRELIWEDGQWLASGWLPARTPTQYLTVRSSRTHARLEFAARGDGALEVSNHLGTDLKHLLLRADDGSYYAMDELGAGKTGSAEAVELGEGMRPFHEARNANLPEFPTGMDTTYFRVGRPRLSGYRRVYDPGLPSPSQSTSRLERLLAAGPGGARSGGAMPRRSYVALAERSPQVELGTPGAREEASYHVIFGEY